MKFVGVREFKQDVVRYLHEKKRPPKSFFSKLLES